MKRLRFYSKYLETMGEKYMDERILKNGPLVFMYTFLQA